MNAEDCTLFKGTSENILFKLCRYQLGKLQGGR